MLTFSIANRLTRRQGVKKAQKCVYVIREWYLKSTSYSLESSAKSLFISALPIVWCVANQSPFSTLWSEFYYKIKIHIFWKFDKSPNFIWNYLLESKKVWIFRHIFVAFSEYMNLDSLDSDLRHESSWDNNYCYATFCQTEHFLKLTIFSFKITYLSKGGLNSESFSIWLKSPKMGAKPQPWALST